MFLRFILAGLAMSFMASAALAAPTQQAIQDKFKTMLPDVIIKDVTKSPIQGFYQIQVDSGKVFYISEDGKYLIQGYLFQLDSNTPKNLTLDSEEKFVANLINNLDRSKMVIFPAKGNKPITHVTIFTDTSCPYCHKLHQGVPALNEKGIEVRYLAFPREGIASRGFDELQKVWCSDNQLEAMNQLMQEIPVKSVKKCDAPIVEQYVLAQKIGIRGTPAIILANGRIIPGYQPANQLASEALAAGSSAQVVAK